VNVVGGLKTKKITLARAGGGGDEYFVFRSAFLDLERRCVCVKSARLDRCGG
jgi:hypothetical protein